MRNDLPPVIGQLTYDVLIHGALRPSIELATLDGVMFEAHHFLCQLGFDAQTGIAKLNEILPDAESIVLRNDESAIMLIYDGSTFHVRVSSDVERLAAIEIDVRSERDETVFAVVPAYIRRWLQESGRYAPQH